MNKRVDPTPKFDSLDRVNLMQMNDVDFDELLECADENIESSAFFASSMQILGILDGTIGAIEDRLTKKKASIMPPPKSNLMMGPHYMPKQQNYIQVNN